VILTDYEYINPEGTDIKEVAQA